MSVKILHSSQARTPHLLINAVCALGAVAAVLMLSVAAARAGTVSNQRPLLFSFDGEGTTAGQFRGLQTSSISGAGSNYTAAEFEVLGGVGALAVDDVSGDVYAVDQSHSAIDKFGSDGKAKNFAAGPAAGTSSLMGTSASQSFVAQSQYFFGLNSDVAVDNSGGHGGAGEGEQGRLYVSGSDAGPIDAFDAQGSFLWTMPKASFEDVCGLAVDAEGHLWVGAGSTGEVLEFASSGSPPAKIDEFAVTSPNKQACDIGIDRSGAAGYVGLPWPDQGEKGVSKYVNGAFDSTLTTVSTRALAVDQAASAGHIFTVEDPFFGSLETKLNEYEPCSLIGCGGSPLEMFGPDQVSDGRGVAYNPAKDWVYVSDVYSQTVKVFGPLADGVAPEVSSQAAADITENEATVNGTINPENVPNSYHFEWIRGETQRVTVEASGGTFRLATGREERGFEPAYTNSMPFDVSAAEMQSELEALYGAGNVLVKGTPADSAGNPGQYTVTFDNGLAGRNLHEMAGDASSVTGGSKKVMIVTVSDGETWAKAQLPAWPETNPSIEPTDGADHAVSQHLTGLHPNTTYDVRLVGTNTEPEGNPEKRLAAYSAPITFTTLPPPAPVVSGLSIPTGEVTTESAHVLFTVNPQKDETVWKVLTSTESKSNATQAECEALQPIAFSVAEEGTIPLGEAGTVSLAPDLAGLEHKQTYCVRVIATNGGGSDTSDAVFTTHATAPSEASLAFVAPRSDTTATLNARINPQGEAPLTVRFEYSADGTNWTSAPDYISTVEARSPILVADEVTGLAPVTTYHYRLALVKNEAGEIAPASLSEEKTFMTRSVAEMELPNRGIELVNNPDKGNQHIFIQRIADVSPVAADGEKLVWTVNGGAPGGTAGSHNSFLATRSSEGWRSQELVPPAKEQVGEGDDEYIADAVSPDYTHFIFEVRGGELSADPRVTYVRLDDRQHQEILAHVNTSTAEDRDIDATSDTAHVFYVPQESKLLQDFGSGTAEVVGLLPDGSPPSCGIDYVRGFKNGNTEYDEPGYHWVAVTDGSRVYFQAAEDGACGGPEGLYMRNRETGKTVQVAREAAFIRATTNGRSAFFATTEQLAGTDRNAHLDVYRWDEEAKPSRQYTCLTCVVSDAEVSKLHGSIYVSDDFSHVYFMSERQLVRGQGKRGDLNIYALSTSGGSPHFVADPNRGDALGSSGALMSHDGNILLLDSPTDLTADRIAPLCPANAANREPHACHELYRYDDRDRSIECVSCLHDGVTSREVDAAGANAFGLSGDGDTVAFVTAQALVASDVNGGVDFYEWHDGAVGLITDGVTELFAGVGGLSLAGVDEDGSNIFFGAVDPGLTGFEHDGVDNLYDARIGGGFPRPLGHEVCSEDACQGPLLSAPPASLPASAFLFGTSYSASASSKAKVKPKQKQKRCKSPRARKHGRRHMKRCVRRKPKRHRRTRTRNARHVGRSGK